MGGGGPLDWSVIGLNAVLAGALGLVLLLTALSAAQVPDPGVPANGYTTLHSPARTTFDVLLDHGDGQAYAALAEDPS